jgi:hypothetical protein
MTNSKAQGSNERPIPKFDPKSVFHLDTGISFDI